jgi:D-beta-D-heptose 7-phosphate kinase/D-beta-D-heptose 1-phosphate adenosyltransferase
MILMLPKDRPSLLSLLDGLRWDKQSIVFTNGCFDILHPGHIWCLEQAASLGDCLIVGLNSDASVRRLKGPKRPIQSESDRAFILSRIVGVSHVVVFEEDTPEELLRLVRPKVLVKGGDWQGRPIAGSEYAETVLTVPYIIGKSTTGFLERMKGGA